MSRLAIPRGIIYHGVLQDIFYLLRAVFVRLNKEHVVEKFENEFAAYMGAKHCVAFPFARTAIYYALRAKNIPHGSEIIMPPITIKPMLDVVLACGLKPVFVDIDPDTLCFEIKKLRNAITSRTRAILITYLFGIVPDVKKMTAICKRSRLFVLEDFSQCLNGKYAGKKIGTFGDVGVYSSSSIKTLDTYGGGLLISNDAGLYHSLRTAQAELSRPRRKDLLGKILIDLVRNLATTRWLFHCLVFSFLRLKLKLGKSRAIQKIDTMNMPLRAALPQEWFTRFTSLQAEIGIEILPHVAKEDLARVKNVNRLKSLLVRSKVNFPTGVTNAENVYWQLMAYFGDAAVTERYFYSNKIDTTTTSLIHIANLPNYPYRGVTPCAQRLHSNGFFIPAYPGLSEQDIQHIAQVLRQMPSKIQT